MKRHIVIDARQYSTSSGRYVRELITGLEKKDKENKYSILLYEQDFEHYQPTNDNFEKVAASFAQFSLAEQFQLLKLIKQLKPDLVHFAFVQQPLFYFRNKITTIHDLTPLQFRSSGTNPLVYWTKKFLYKIMIRSALFSSKSILVPTEYTKNELTHISKKHSSKILVTYEAGVEANKTKKAYEPMTGKKYIMYTGRAAPHKNLNALVDCFTLLQNNNPDLQLVFVGGDKNFNNLESYVTKKKISNINFTGFILDSELNWLYSHALAYVFPSLSEGFGLPGLEAMVHGAPVVSSNATCLPEVYGDAALYFNPIDVEDMALKIERVLSDKSFRSQLIAKGYKQIKKYSWDKTAEQTLEVYKKALQD